MLIIGMNKITAHKKHCINVQYGYNNNNGVNIMKTINMNISMFGKPKYKDLNLEEYSKRWIDVTSQIHWLANTTEGFNKVKLIQTLVKELSEENFNRLWDKENS